MATETMAFEKRFHMFGERLRQLFDPLRRVFIGFGSVRLGGWRFGGRRFGGRRFGGSGERRETANDAERYPRRGREHRGDESPFPTGGFPSGELQPCRLRVSRLRPRGLRRSRSWNSVRGSRIHEFQGNRWMRA